MKLQSCKACGVVVDADRLEFDDHWDGEEQEYGEDAVYINKEFVATAKCPVCDYIIIEDDKE